MFQLLQESFSTIKDAMTDKEYNEFITSAYENLYLYHFSIGLLIRNTVLQTNNVLYKFFLDMGITQKDAMSEIIICCFYLCQREIYISSEKSKTFTK